MLRITPQMLMFGLRFEYTKRLIASIPGEGVGAAP
jgi:hypothetical protein